MEKCGARVKHLGARRTTIVPFTLAFGHLRDVDRNGICENIIDVSISLDDNWDFYPGFFVKGKLFFFSLVSQFSLFLCFACFSLSFRNLYKNLIRKLTIDKT